MTDLSGRMKPTKKVVRNLKKRNTVNPNNLAKDVMTLELADALLDMNSMDNARPSNDIRFAVKSFLQNTFDKYTKK